MNTNDIYTKKSKLTNLDRLQRLSSIGLIAGIFGIVIGTLSLIIGFILINMVHGKGASILGIIVLFALLILCCGVPVLLFGIFSTIPSVVGKKFFKYRDIKYLKAIKSVSIAEIVLAIVIFLSMSICLFIGTNDSFFISLKTGILFLIEIGVPINIVPIMYIYRVDKALNEQNYQ